MTAHVLELASRLATDPSCRQFVGSLKAGSGVADALEVLLPNLPHNEQRILCTVVAFRLMGTMMPASPELFAHLPLTHRISEQELFAAAQALVDGGVLETAESDDKTEMCFMWPSLERLIAAALAEQNAPRLVGPDGERLG